MATQNVDFVVEFAPFKEFKLIEGLSPDVLEKDGKYEVKLERWSSYNSKANGFPMAKLILRVQDEDERGKLLIRDVCCGGKDKNGEDLGRQLMSFLVSAGTEETAIQTNAANNAKANISQILNAKVGKVCWVEVQRDIYEGNLKTEVKDFIHKETYEQAKAVSAHRKTPRTVGTTAGPQAGQVNVGGAANGAAAGQPTAGAPLPML